MQRIRYLRPLFSFLTKITTENESYRSYSHRRTMLNSIKNFENGRKTEISLAFTGFWTGLMTLAGFEDEDAAKKRDEEFILTIKRGILAMQRQQYDRAEIILHIALSTAQSIFHQEAIMYITALLANNAFLARDYEKSEKLYKIVLSYILSTGVSQDAESVIEASLKIATILSRTNRQAEAEIGYQFAIETQEKRLKNIDISAEEFTVEEINSLALMGMAYESRGKHYLSMSKFDLALTDHEKALVMCRLANGHFDEQTMVLLNDIGTIYNLKCDIEQALHYFNEAYKVALTLESDYIPIILINIGMTNVQNERWEVGKSFCEKAFQIVSGQEIDSEIAKNLGKCFKLCEEHKFASVIKTENAAQLK